MREGGAAAWLVGMVGRIPVMNVMPLVDLGRQPAKATVGEPFKVSATVFREGHDKLSAEVVLTDPSGARRAPVRMVKHAEVPDLHEAWVTPDVEGAWSFEVQAWSDPLATWQHDAGIKIPAGVDVELMFLEGRLLFERVLGSLDPTDTRAREVLEGAVGHRAQLERERGLVGEDHVGHRAHADARSVAVVHDRCQGHHEVRLCPSLAGASGDAHEDGGDLARPRTLCSRSWAARWRRVWRPSRSSSLCR